MKRLVLAVVLSISVIASPAPVAADAGHARPRITRFEFTERPLKAGTLERLVVVAHDPDSWISEIQVQWFDQDDNGGAIFAHTYCVQDPEFTTPGTPATLKLDLTFERAGSYQVEARAISQKRCEGGNDTRFSPTIERQVLVKPVTRTFTDPDDTTGPLDVLTASQSQDADEAGLGTNLRHQFRFSEDLGSAPLSGRNDFVKFRFDTRGDDGVADRTVRVDAGKDGALRAAVRDRSGSKVGEATVTTNGAVLTLEVDRRLLGRGSGRYGWSASTYDSVSEGCSGEPCEDRAPDKNLFIHNL